MKQRTKHLEIKLFKLISGHFICRGYINKQPSKFLIDTGATNSCADSNKKEKFSLKAGKLELETGSIGKDKLSVTMSDQCLIKLGRYNLGMTKFALLDMKHVNAMLTKQGMEEIDGIIGADFLHKHQAIIDYARGMLSLMV